jgi:hypothetical protein
MGNFFTDGRLALIAALQADAEIDGRIRTYFDFGPGLRRRNALQPAFCPALSVAPAEGAERRVANVEREIPQVFRVELATAGQDVAPCEELTALVLARVAACNQTRLGLAPEGLTGLRVRTIAWQTVPGPEEARLLWTATIEVELLWRRL